uniref:Uncharacterized protein n=1 Tax=Romanomermis culicivorax TaxID=13658 RepID=A0A915KFB5_ROMCU
MLGEPSDMNESKRAYPGPLKNKWSIYSKEEKQLCDPTLDELLKDDDDGVLLTASLFSLLCLCC